MLFYYFQVDYDFIFCFLRSFMWSWTSAVLQRNPQNAFSTRFDSCYQWCLFFNNAVETNVCLILDPFIHLAFGGVGGYVGYNYPLWEKQLEMVGFF